MSMKMFARIAFAVILVLVVIPILIALSATPAHAAETAPSAYQTLQPFKHFEKGEGEGVAYLYKARTKADFIAILRDKSLAKKEMRVKCEVLVRQMMEGHADLPFEGCEGTAKAIEGDDFTVIACRDEMFKQNNFLTVTNANGSAFGVWHRKCLPNEKVLVYKDQLLLSTTCLNVAVPVTPLKVPPSSTPTPVPTKVQPFAKYALQINCMRDREGGFWQDRYESAKARRAEYLTRGNINQKGMVPYYEVFTLAPFGDMLAERKSRPLDCTFFVRFVKKEPVLDIQSGDSTKERAAKYNGYLKQFQYPQDANVISSQWASTGSRGWVIIPVTIPLDQFEAVLIQPEYMGDVLEPLIAVHRPEFATQSNPVHIWEVKRPQ